MAESNAAGVPVIASDLGSCREVIADGKTDFLVKNVEQAVAAVGKLGNINRADCRRRVEENFTVECMARGYEKVYKKIFELEQNKRK
jgi:glycosyltransferase involved in cell wall biosynthesis